MFDELTIKTTTGEFSVFLQDGFYIGDISPNLHSHNFSELHLVIGDATYDVEGEVYKLSGASLFVIPRQRFHICTDFAEGVKHRAFQLSCEISAPRVISITESLADAFLEEIAVCRRTFDYNKVAAYIAFLCSDLTSGEDVKLNQVRDCGFLIHEFISLNYKNDAPLSDLADFLHVSARQAERLVVRVTGKPYRRAIAAMRIKIAKMLMRNTDMPLAEVAHYVGYNSYSGFWKALRAEDEYAE